VDVRLLEHRVVVWMGLRREPEPEHVERDDAREARAEVVPDVVPVPRRRREAVDAEQGGGGCRIAGDAMEDRVGAVRERRAGGAPLVEGQGARLAMKASAAPTLVSGKPPNVPAP
jgi:hypothetical protein